MINEYELRKGNYFLADGVVKKALHLEEDVIEFDSYSTEIDLKVADYVSYKDAEPIPLTPEVLEKCGFKKEKWSSTGQYLLRTSRFGFGVINNELNIYDFEKPNNSASGISQIKITYLHQLQNLFFALTGTELTYTP